MTDKNDFDTPSDDEWDDSDLDENFEFDEEDFDLDSETEFDESDHEEDFDDEWDDGDVVSDSSTTGKSKFSLNFNTIVILGAVVVGALVMMSQVGKEKAATQVENPPQVVIPTALKMQGAFQGPGAIDKEKGKSDLSVPDIEQKTSEEEGGFLFDADTLGDSAKDIMKDAPPMPSPITSGQDGMIEQQKTADLKETPDTIDNSLEAENKPIGNTQIPSAPDDADVVFPKDEVVLDDVKATKVADPVENTDSQMLLGEVQDAPQDLKEVALEEKQQEQQQVQQEISEKIEVEDRQVVSSSLDQKLDSIIQRLDSIENRINETENNNNSQIQIITADIESLKQKATMTTESKPVTIQKEVEKPPVEKAAKKTVKKPVVKKVAKKVTWELRAAQPGKAWVSRKGQKNMQPVVVGDKLTGIGRIQSIDHLNGRWIVQGSTGKITQ